MSHADPSQLRGSRARAAGQSIVEFAFVVPLFLTLVVGLVDGGRLVATNNTIAQAASEAARRAAVQAAYIGTVGIDCRAPVCPSSTGEFSDNVVSAANRMTGLVGTIAAPHVHITCSPLGSAPTGDWTGGNACASSNDPGNVVTVRIDMPVQPLTPLLDSVYPDRLSASATMAIP